MLIRKNLFTLLIALLYILFFISISQSADNPFDGEPYWEMPAQQWIEFPDRVKIALLEAHAQEWLTTHQDCKTVEVLWKTEKDIIQFYVHCFQKENREQEPSSNEFRGKSERRI